jgi:ABC-2 type transport system permease protein
MMAMSAIRVLIGVMPAALLAIWLYEFSIFTLGLPLLAFFACLMLTSWAVGMMVTALVLRYGLGAESLAWFIIFLLAPVSAVYYPVETLPHWLQLVSWALPTTYVFEGMRSVLFGLGFRTDLFLGALGLDALYMLLGMAAYMFSFRQARRRGLLLQVGE